MKAIRCHWKRIVAVLAPIAVLAMLVFWAMAPSSQGYGSIITRGPGNERLVALTFDDGPNDPWTLLIAGELERHQVKGTFFVVGHNADVSPKTVRELVSRGHVVGNHSYHHQKRYALFQLQYDELDQAEASINRAADVCPALFRPPNGFHTPWQLHAVSSAGMRTIGWNVQPEDWKLVSAETLAARVIDDVRPGSIVLMHDGIDMRQNADRSATLAALPRIIEELQARGYRFVTVPELLSLPAYRDSCDAG